MKLFNFLFLRYYFCCKFILGFICYVIKIVFNIGLLNIILDNYNLRLENYSFTLFLFFFIENKGISGYK